MASSDKSATYMEYISRINRVQDYIEANLSGDLSLDILAEVSGFSKFHFHRIFSGIVKETLLNYINRIRMERAISLLLRNPSMSITEIAMMLGFSESAAFSRLFKRHFGKSATEVRQNYSKNCQVDSKNGKSIYLLPRYNEGVTNTSRKEDIMLGKGNVEVGKIKEIRAIYLRHMGSYEEFAVEFQGMMRRLMNWAKVKGLLNNNSKPFVIYHDNPEFTKQDNLKTSMCLTVSEDAEVEGEIGKIVIPAGKYAIGHFQVDEPRDHTTAWNYIYSEWLPNSGLQPDDGCVFEMYMNDPNTHPEKKHFIDIYLPVKSL
ncbi:AraC family transcriptional regulator [Dethiothermospora halolimnae]|uniref:AraC family transcriptional regulator n=1 Tax=Dethiothermospora halolimnae TaxID=3114390 RepID=UPI003CCBE8BE